MTVGPDDIEYMPLHKSKRKNIAFRPRIVNLREARVRQKLISKEINRIVLEGESSAGTADRKATERRPLQQSDKERPFRSAKSTISNKLRRVREEESSEEEIECANRYQRNLEGCKLQEHRASHVSSRQSLRVLARTHHVVNQE